MIRCFYIVFALLALTSCRVETGINSFSVDVDSELRKDVSFFDWFQCVRVIPLDEYCIVGNGQYSEPQYLSVSDDKIFILDDKTYNVYSFNLDGSFDKVISRRGRGAGEYSLAYAVRSSDCGNNITVLDPRGSLYFYSDEFVVKTEIKGIRAMHNFENAKGKSILFSSTEKPNLWMLKDGVPRSLNYISKIPLKGQFNAPNPFIKKGDELYYYEAFSGDIYNIDLQKETIDLMYSWDFGIHTSVMSNLSESGVDFFDYLKGESFDKVYPFLSIVMIGDCIFSDVLFQNEEYNLFYNIASRKCAFFKEFKEGVRFKTCQVKGDKLYLLVESDMVSKYVNDSILISNSGKPLDQISKRDNCVLLEYRTR